MLSQAPLGMKMATAKIVNVLGIESSCDETAAAVVADGARVLSDVVSSQVAIHRPYGGVVPELASRAHVVNLVPVVEEALARAGVGLDGIDGIAVTRGPGLVGALLVGVQAAKAIAFARGLPLVGVNHLEGHLTAIFLHDRDEAPHPVPAFPHLALLVSGGHTLLLVCRAPGDFQVLGATRDDAAGEAFDKVAKMLGLGYPGGAVIDRLAKRGDASSVKLPRAMRGRGLDFSFSGLKTAAAEHLARHGRPEGQALADLCAAFQRAVVEQLVRKTIAALQQTGLSEVQVGGGVAANSELREALAREAGGLGVRVHVPPLRRCTDNGAMIAAAGWRRLARGERADVALNATASLPLG
jgi:tRNA N6-adenosine threonylcarbamoyltransferase